MSEFGITVKEAGEIRILALQGYLDAHTAPVLEDEFTKAITDKRFKLVVNFADLKYISSAGLGVFMAYIETLRENNGDIKLSAMQSAVFNIFDLLGFPLLYTITETDEQAIAAFSQPTERTES